MQALPVDDERLLERGQTALGDGDAGGGILEARQQKDEFVASPARQRVAVPDAGLEPGAGDLEQRVAHAVTERVVDVLEAVDIDHQHGQLRALAARLGETAGKALVEQEAVREAWSGDRFGPDHGGALPCVSDR